MIKKQFIPILSILLITLIYLNINYTTLVLKDVYTMWYEKILPTIPVSYFCGNILYQYNNIIKFFFPFIKRILSFENDNSFVLFIISFIVGNPTSTILILTAFEENKISSNETKRLLRFSSFISIFFILFMFEIKYSMPLILGCLFSSIVINNHEKAKHSLNLTIVENIDIFCLINKLPNILLNILSTMLICSFIEIPFNILFSKSIFLYPTLLSFLEITKGLNILTELYTGIILIFFSSILLSSHGLAILLQVIAKLKEKTLNIKDYIKYRIINSILSSLFSILFYLVFIFLF